jgi:hypothetical protein
MRWTILRAARTNVVRLRRPNQLVYSLEIILGKQMAKKFVIIYSLFQVLLVSMQSSRAADTSASDPVRYYIESSGGNKVPVTHLDAVVTRLEGKISLHSFYDFSALEQGTEELAKFLSNYAADIERNNYSSIDHLILVFEIGGMKAAVINLENSTRSSEAGHPLHLRLDKIVELVNKAKDNGVQLFFFSEACRHSFPAGIKVTPAAIGSEEKKWDEIRSTLIAQCDLRLLKEEVNNKNNPGLPFGVMAMVTMEADELVIESNVIQLLKEGGNGCIAISVTMNANGDGSVEPVTFVGTQLPLNFQLGEQAPYVKALDALKEIFTDDENIVIFGDFNTVSDEHYAVIRKVLPATQFTRIPSFYAAYFDVLPKHENTGSWVQFEELGK